jgi:hypothetical protein
MTILSASWDALPSHRTEGLAASVTIHLAVLACLASVPAAPSDIQPTLAVVSVERAAPPGPGEAGTSEEFEETPAPDVSDTPGLRLPAVDVDIEKIRRQSDTLFPFVTAPLPFLDELSQRRERRSDRLRNPFARDRERSDRPALTLAPGQLQQLVDGAWSRRTRWQSFSQIAALLRRHDPYSGDTATLVRAHLDQNLLQPYFDGPTRDPRFWVMLGLAADHQSFIEFVGTFVREHPSSRTTTELLFMVDEFAQASRDAMLMLLSTDPRALLADTFEADREAFALAQSIYFRYSEWARLQGLSRTDALRARFDDVRVGILRAIIDTTPDGYGATDARHLLGLIYWDRRDVEGALRWWRDLPTDGRDSYREAAAAITRELTRAGGGRAAAVSSILGAEYRRWLTFSAARLEEFGYAFDTF